MYQGIYKCRLCGEEYIDCATENEKNAMDCVYGINGKEYFYPDNCLIGLHRMKTHRCKDGSFGLSDFQGFKKTEED